MVITREQKKTALAHVFVEILDLEDHSKLHKACESKKVVSMEDLLALTPVDIKELAFVDDMSNKIYISKGQRGLVFVLQAFSHKRDGEGN
jgi:hypothetical protein